MRAGNDRKVLASGMEVEAQRVPNKALQLTDNPLRGLSAAELGRYAASKISLTLRGFVRNSYREIPDMHRNP